MTKTMISTKPFIGAYGSFYKSTSQQTFEIRLYYISVTSHVWWTYDKEIRTSYQNFRLTGW